MNHHDASDLLGAYALHACGPEERRAVERHISRCTTCRAALAPLSQVVKLLDDARLVDPADRHST